MGNQLEMIFSDILNKKKKKGAVEKPLLFVEDKKVLVFTYFFFHLCPASHEVTHLAQSFRHV